MAVGKRILCIDDSKSVHAFMKECLKDEGYEIHSAFDGEEGLRVLQTAPKSYDLVLLDWEMPRMTGPEVLQKIGASDRRFKIVMVTSKNVPEEIQSALNLGADDYVMKPFTRDIITEKVRSALGV